MQLTNQFTVHAGLSTAWSALNDVERIAPFVPGFSLLEAEGDTYRGTVKVKVGAVTVSYNAEIRVLERNEPAGRVVMAISGRERRGPGSMEAKVTSSLAGEGPSTRISLTTDLNVTGRVAQFGSGILQDVSEHLIAQFVAALESHLRAEQEGPDASSDSGASADLDAAAATEPALASTTTPTPANPRETARTDTAPLDLTTLVGGSMLRQAGPLAIGALLIAVLSYLAGRRH